MIYAIWHLQFNFVCGGEGEGRMATFQFEIMTNQCGSNFATFVSITQVMSCNIWNNLTTIKLTFIIISLVVYIMKTYVNSRLHKQNDFFFKILIFTFFIQAYGKMGFCGSSPSSRSAAVHTPRSCMSEVDNSIRTSVGSRSSLEYIRNALMPLKS